MGILNGLTRAQATLYQAKQPISPIPLIVSVVSFPVSVSVDGFEKTESTLPAPLSLRYFPTMETREWIKAAQTAGWKVTARGLTIELKCSKYGCPGALTVQLDCLNIVPDACGGEHVGQYASHVYGNYADLVGELALRRRSLGLSQEDVCFASGLADGHINKLEAFARTAQMPTLQLWAQTLGLKMTLAPAPMPAATIAAIEQRPAPLREVRKSKPLTITSIGDHHDIQAAE